MVTRLVAGCARAGLLLASATSIAPGWEEIGKLAATATIRTALNYFLEREMRVPKEMDEADPAKGEVQR